MTMRNKIKQFISDRGLTVYQFRQQTGIANKTAYDLVNKPEQYPAREVMDKICSAFKIQPGELIEWVDEQSPDHFVTAAPDEPPAAPELPPKRKRGTASRRRSTGATVKETTAFRVGQMVKNPAGWRGWITRMIDDDRAVVDWEGRISDDEIPLHLLTACE